MKRLYLIRHAKTEASGYDYDFDRCLVEQGYEDIKIVSNFLINQNFQINKIIASAAKRTIQTSESLAKIMSIELIETHKELYTCNLEMIMDYIKTESDTIENLAIIGHNPTMHHFAYELGCITNNYPPFSISIFENKTNHWVDFFDTKIMFLKYVFPKMLKN